MPIPFQSSYRLGNTQENDSHLSKPQKDGDKNTERDYFKSK